MYVVPLSLKAVQGALLLLKADEQIKIEFIEDGMRKEFFIGLDNHELAELKQAVERAEAKIAELTEILRKADVPYVDVSAEVK